jgi:Zn-dependent alcohol dehydrogenase
MSDESRPEQLAAEAITRRRALQQAATLGSAAVLGSTGLSAEASGSGQTAGPSVAGRPFRAFVRHRTSGSVQQLRMRPLHPRGVVVRTEASQCCCSVTSQVLGTQDVAQAVIPGHGGVGVVEAVGPTVRRVQVGDRVLVAVTPQCGQCYHCLRGRANGIGRGPDFTIEAVGGDRFPPRAEVGPDPTGVLALRQAWEMCVPGGHFVTTGTNQQGTLSFPPGRWSLFGKTHHPSQYGGVNAMRDLPRFVRLIEAGLFNARSLATDVFSLDRTREAFQAVADRTTVAAVVTFT